MGWSLFKPRVQRAPSVRLQDGTVFNVLAGETVLDAALRAGLPAPHNCRVGACTTCRCTLVGGTARSLVDRCYVLTQEDIRSGTHLACQMRPTSDIEVHWRMGGPRLEAHTATIVARRPLTARVWRMSLLIETRFAALPGQHVEIMVGCDGYPPVVRPFSVVHASTGSTYTRLDIDVARRDNGAVSAWLTRDDAVGSALQIAGPFGTCCAEDRGGPLLTIGAGSGIGAAAGVLSRSHATRPRRQTMLLAYGTRTADLYGLEELALGAQQAGARHRSLAWARHGPFDTPMVSQGRAPDGLLEALIEHGTVRDGQVLLYGPGGFIDTCMGALTAAGIPPHRIRCDRYQPPRAGASPVPAGHAIGG